MKLVNQKYQQYLGTNPYKGFVPFLDEGVTDCSMEFFYIPLNEIELSPNNYSWQKFEERLNEINSRNHLSIVRVYLDYPAAPSGIPQYYFNHTKRFKYSVFGGGEEVDFNDKWVVSRLKSFIKNFGKNYDGDKRIAFIQCGLIGHWGEWHTYPDDNLMANIHIQEEIIRCYLRHFKKTKLLVRYPKFKFMRKYNIGFHDDSFCYSTQEFLGQMKGARLANRYLKCAIGGEIRPEEQDSLNMTGKSQEDFDWCVKNTHASWQINRGAFVQSANRDIVQKLSASLGYDYYVESLSLSKHYIKIDIVNKGVAPLYFDFKVYVNYHDKKGNIIHTQCLGKLKRQVNLRHTYKCKIVECNYISLIAKDELGQVLNFSNSKKISNCVLLAKQ